MIYSEEGRPEIIQRGCEYCTSPSQDNMSVSVPVVLAKMLPLPGGGELYPEKESDDTLCGREAECPPHLRTFVMTCYSFVSSSVSTITTIIPLSCSSLVLTQPLLKEVPSFLWKKLAPLSHCTFTLCHNEVWFCLVFPLLWLFSITANFLILPPNVISVPYFDESVN